MDRGAWQATVHGVAKSQTQLSEHKISQKQNCTRIIWVSYQLFGVQLLLLGVVSVRFFLVAEIINSSFLLIAVLYLYH